MLYSNDTWRYMNGLILHFCMHMEEVEDYTNRRLDLLTIEFDEDF